MNTFHCLLVVLPAATFAALAPRPGSIVPTPESATRADAAAVAAPGEKVEKTGKVSAWYVFADGTVGLRLTGQDKEQLFSTWFITPADKTETTRFEHLMLASLLRLSDSREPLTIAYEQTNEKLGKTLKDALPIVAVMWGTSYAEASGSPAPKK